MKYRVTYRDGHMAISDPLDGSEEADIADTMERWGLLSIVRDDQRLVSPRKVHERAMELWVNEGAPGDELPEGRHYRRALADLEGEAIRAAKERADGPLVPLSQIKAELES